MKKTVFLLIVVFVLANSYAEASMVPFCPMPVMAARSAMPCCQPGHCGCDMAKPAAKPIGEVAVLFQNPDVKEIFLDAAALPEFTGDLSTQKQETSGANSLKSPPRNKLYRLHSDFRI